MLVCLKFLSKVTSLYHHKGYLQLLSSEFMLSPRCETERNGYSSPEQNMENQSYNLKHSNIPLV